MLQFPNNWKLIPYQYGACDKVSSFSLTNSSLHVQQDKTLSKIFCPAPISKVFPSPQKNELVGLKSHQEGRKKVLHLVASVL